MRDYRVRRLLGNSRLAQFVRDMADGLRNRQIPRATGHIADTQRGPMGADGLRSVVRTESNADESLAQRLKHTMDDHAGSRGESTRVGDLSKRSAAGHDERPSNPDSTGSTRPRSSDDAQRRMDEVQRRIDSLVQVLRDRARTDHTPRFSGDDDGPPAALIDRRSAELGLHTPAQGALESSLFISRWPHHRPTRSSRFSCRCDRTVRQRGRQW